MIAIVGIVCLIIGTFLGIIAAARSNWENYEKGYEDGMRDSK